MADVTVTAADVQPITGSTQTQDGTAGATITAGQPVYLDSADTKYKPADADNSSATATVRGIALHGASDGQPLKIASAGTLDPGFTVTVGEIYVLSGTAGGIAPVADLALNDWVSVIGVGTAAGVLDLILKNSGVQVP